MSAWVIIRGGLADDMSKGVTIFDLDFMEDQFVDTDTVDEAYRVLDGLEEVPELEATAQTVRNWIEKTEERLGIRTCGVCGMSIYRDDCKH
jgi:hypothetical protein